MSRIAGVAQLFDAQHKKDFLHLVTFIDKQDGKLWMLLNRNPMYRANWNDFEQTRVSSSYKGFRMEFIYD